PEGELGSMRGAKFATAAVIGLVASLGALTSAAATPANIDVSRWHHNESEETVAVNPTNPDNVVIVSNVDVPAAGMFEAYTTDGGASWTRQLIGDNDSLGAACCDPSLSWDSNGNLFLAYLYNVGNFVPVALSTDGGAS